MVQIFRRLSLLTLVLFILGIFISGYSLLTFPSSLTNTPAFDNSDLPSISPLVFELNLKVLLTFTAGIAAVVLAFLFEKKSSRENKNIVYVQAGKDTKSDVVKKNIGIEEEEQASFDSKEFELIISAEDHQNEKIRKILSKLCMNVSASQGAFYKPVVSEDGVRKIELMAAFAFSVPDSEKVTFEYGEGLAGQAAKEEKKVLIDEIPEGYIKILSGLGESSPRHLFILPVKIQNGELFGVVEISSFNRFKNVEQDLIENVFSKLANASKESSQPVASEIQNEEKKKSKKGGKKTNEE